ncbi:MAG TPA: inositol monophosphatase family protein [Candidatus Nanoarchaeia archaeon]|nr:inositol monophosphatase family protein [Candidatus Nanoarchaeia archaeon]
MMPDDDNLIEIIEEALFNARLIHNKYYNNKEAYLAGKFGGDSKGDAVTVADKETEEWLRQFYQQRLPGYNFLGEETGSTAKYDGQGLFTINDPLDGTWNFMQGIPNFGAITAVCEQGQVAAAGYSNTCLEQAFVASRNKLRLKVDLGIQRYEPVKPQIYLGCGPADDPEQVKELRALVQEKFPEIKLSQDGAAINAACVFAGLWPVFFHTGLAQHDISPVSLFSEITKVPATDHRGRQYVAIDPAAEIKKYQSGQQELLYHNSILVAEPRSHEAMLKILERFHPWLDAKQQAGNDYAKIAGNDSFHFSAPSDIKSR